MGNCCMKRAQTWDGKLMIDMDCPYCHKFRSNDSKAYDKHMLTCIDVSQYFRYDIDDVIKI
jgi:hypothetical protein